MSRIKRAGAAAGAVALLAVAAACSSSSGSTTGSGSSGGPGGGTQTVEFAISGLGSEGQYTETQVAAFEKANPHIKVHIDVDSSSSTTFLQQVGNAFIAGSSTPDLIESDVTYTAKWAAAGYIQPVSCDPSAFNASILATGTIAGKQYSCPWFLNVEGLWYRTDLVPTPPTTPQQVVDDARAAMAKDKSLKEGIAFEGSKYEGAITVYMMLDKAFGGSLSNLSNVNTPQNVAALNYLHSLIYQEKIAPTDVVTYTEDQTGTDFASGYAAFSTNWPYVAGLPLAPSVKGHIGYIPFPAASGGQPGVALGGEVLSVNAKTKYPAAVNALISYLTSPAQQTARALAVSDAPAVTAAYTPALLAASPIWKQVQTLAPLAAARPVNPNYLNVSTDLQEMISSAYADASTTAASSAFSQYSSKIATDASASA